VVFPRIAARLGTTFALRHWELMQAYSAILTEHPDDDEAEPYVEEFAQWIIDEHGPEVLLEFAQVCRFARIIRGGIERRLVARAALKKQLARVRRR
jgi:hypothetical protein